MGVHFKRVARYVFLDSLFDPHSLHTFFMGTEHSSALFQSQEFVIIEYGGGA